MCCFSMLEIQGDAYVFGGRSGRGFSAIVEKAIYKLRCSSDICEWSTINQELKTARAYQVAIPVPDDLCV